jgi:hypothetical protein
VIDYRADFKQATNLDAGQANMLTAVLEILVKDGILKQTDGIVIIISKSDYMPQNEDRNVFANMYLKENYLYFINILTGHVKSHGINKANNYKPYIVPFSLGKFMLGRTFTYNPDDSTVVVNAILALSRVNRKKKIWNILKR